MRVTFDNQPVGDGKCRWCKRRAKWSVQRPGRYIWENLCHSHLGLALKNYGVTSVAIERTATATIEVS